MKRIINNQLNSHNTGLSMPGGQRGLTLISWLVIIVFLLFQAVIALKVIPVYMDDFSVRNIMKELPDDIKAMESSKSELQLLIVKRLRVNNVRRVGAEDIVIKKGRGEYIVTIDYEPRGTLIGNMDYIMNFSHEARIPKR